MSILIHMPTPVRKKKEPDFVPDYYCPVCEEKVPPRGTARRPIWHEECKPHPRDPKRQERICPGCGTRHTLPFEPGRMGNPSAFCKPECKQAYMKTVDPEKFSEGPRPFNCKECGEHVPTYRFKRQKKAKLCVDCFGYYLDGVVPPPHTRSFKHLKKQGKVK